MWDDFVSEANKNYVIPPNFKYGLRFAVRHEGGKNQWMKVPPKQLSVQLGSYLSG
jgi:hypothetical protein